MGRTVSSLKKKYPDTEVTQEEKREMLSLSSLFVDRPDRQGSGGQMEGCGHQGGGGGDGREGERSEALLPIVKKS